MIYKEHVLCLPGYGLFHKSPGVYFAHAEDYRAFLLLLMINNAMPKHTTLNNTWKVKLAILSAFEVNLPPNTGPSVFIGTKRKIKKEPII
jgi:hypothetical protein